MNFSGIDILREYVFNESANMAFEGGSFFDVNALGEACDDKYTTYKIR